MGKHHRSPRPPAKETGRHDTSHLPLPRRFVDLAVNLLLNLVRLGRTTLELLFPSLFTLPEASEFASPPERNDSRAERDPADGRERVLRQTRDPCPLRPVETRFRPRRGERDWELGPREREKDEEEERRLDERDRKVLGQRQGIGGIRDETAGGRSSAAGSLLGLVDGLLRSLTLKGIIDHVAQLRGHGEMS